ncbi:DUF975 family protein [Mediterraneibacter agrestimuris]|uniref:DUF975 family protein n=1 Tax=Mediterraneibacter agrestimuris TaxID=2941333 RepID=UPI00203B42CF|nr:DUF975 family protein [Mediterraneibacter agrestimuris]
MNKWTRKKMKEIGKSRMKANYWKSLLVAVLLVAIVGMGTAGAAGNGNDRYRDMYGDSISASVTEVEGISDDNTDIWEEYSRNTSRIVMIVVLIIVLLFMLTVALLFNIFVGNPVFVGGSRFFYQNLDKNADVKEICYTFDRGYKNAVKTMFFRDLYTFLWTLLFIIPGICKYYEYSIIPYLLAENENMTKEEAFAESRRLMKGNKWRAFVLDLSFIPWLFLSAVTLGMVGVFYVTPYMYSTGAAFYQALKEEDLFRIASENE